MVIMSREDLATAGAVVIAEVVAEVATAEAAAVVVTEEVVAEAATAEAVAAEEEDKRQGETGFLITNFFK